MDEQDRAKPIVLTCGVAEAFLAVPSLVPEQDTTDPAPEPPEPDDEHD